MKTPLVMLVALGFQTGFAKDDRLATTADRTVPRVKEELPMNPGAAVFHFGPLHEGIRLGILSVEPKYHLNHRINVWTRVETEKSPHSGHSLMAGDPLFDESFLYVTTSNGTLVTRIAVGGDIDGMPGVSRIGGISDHLHRAIRMAGDYRVQWKTKRWESGVATFKVLPE